MWSTLRSFRRTFKVWTMTVKGFLFLSFPFLPFLPFLPFPSLPFPSFPSFPSLPFPSFPSLPFLSFPLVHPPLRLDMQDAPCAILYGNIILTTLLQVEKSRKCSLIALRKRILTAVQKILENNCSLNISVKHRVSCISNFVCAQG